MKKFIIVILISFSFQLSAFSLSLAASPSPTISPTQEKAKELKEKVASKIAELKILQKRAFLGTIKSLTDKGFVLTAQNKDITVETDTNTKIISLSKGARKTLKLTDLTKGQKILVWGQFNKEAEVLTAKSILVRIFSLNLHGTVKSIEKNTLTIKDYTIDISQAKIRNLKKDKTIAKIEPKEITEGDFVHAYVTPKTEGEKTTYTAWRVLILPKNILQMLNLVQTPNLGVSTPSPSPKPSPIKNP